MRTPAAALLLAATSIPAASETHPFGVHDMLAMERLSDPRPSPDGQWVAFTLRSTDLEGNRGRTDLWLIGRDGRGLRRLTTSEASDTSPRWTADGAALLFLSARGGSSQVYRLRIAGGEAEPVTAFPLDVANLVPFPDGERIAFSLEVYPDARTLEETVERDARRGAAASSARVYDELLFRHWDTWEDGKRSHVFVWRLGSGAAPIDLMRGWDADSPTRPFGGPEEIAISPDGREVAFVAKRVGREAAWSTDTDVWTAPADGSSGPIDVTGANPAWDGSPAYSPDGRFLAWLAMERPGFEADRRRIVLMDRASGARHSLAEAWDRSPGEIAWSPDSAVLFASADNLGNRSLFALDAAGDEVRTLVERGWNGSPAPAGSQVVFLHDDLRSPAELMSVPAAGGAPRALTAINAERVAAARMGDYEPFAFPGWNGETVHGYLVKPADYRVDRKYPVAFIVHGGPQGSMGDHFHYRWNPQAFAGAGYAVVFVDFHGSTGYGQAFTDSITGDWGGKPYQDLMMGLDYALERFPFLDESRVAALGASYGGYMINWIAGQTDRFRCLVNHDGLFDTRMMYFDTEELWFPEWEHGGPPWEAGETFAAHNPAERVARWKTPMLVIHGALDYRVTETQGFATFTALQRRGIPSRLLHFPDENHWVLKPRNSIRWHEEVLAWLERWLGGAR